MESDERFKHLALDPRFKNLRKKQRKIKIDDRFQGMFKDEKFTLKYSHDKRGRKQNKTTGDDMKKFYSLEDESEMNEKTTIAKGGVDDVEDEVVADAEDDFENNAKADDEGNDDDANSDIEDDDEEDASETDPEELSSSSDESESEFEDDSVGIDIKNIEFDWQPLDHDAETADTTSRRLAIQNLDWDHLDVKDIYTLVHSIRPPLNVKIYVSEFGKERLKQEEIEGPKEIVEMPKVDEVEEEYNQLKDKMKALKNIGQNTYKVNEYEDADEELDPKNEELRERIRKYQLNRMKYYYAVAEFDSVESAELVYKELDGMEYEGSSLELDLRFVPNDIEFDPEDIKAECDKVPDLASYKAPLFINSALQQTTVKFTWDETDTKRQEKLHRAYTKDELEMDDLDAYLASETESDEGQDEEEDFNDSVSVVTANSEARVNKYKMLLKSLEEEEEKKKKVDVDVEWGNYSEDENELGETGDVGEVDEAEGNAFSDDAPECQTKRDNKKSKKGKKKGRKAENDDHEDEDGELDLLVMDVNRRRDEFEFNPDDDRFKAVYESGLYNIDPSHPNFKRTQAFDMIAEKKREKRQKTSF